MVPNFPCCNGAAGMAWYQDEHSGLGSTRTCTECLCRKLERGWEEVISVQNESLRILGVKMNIEIQVCLFVVVRNFLYLSIQSRPLTLTDSSEVVLPWYRSLDGVTLPVLPSFKVINLLFARWAWPGLKQAS